MTLGQYEARNQAQNRIAVGSPVTVGGVATYAITASDTQIGDNLPDGSRNAANADKRIFNVTPADFIVAPATAPTPPSEGASVVWLGMSYTITAVLPVVYGGEIISYRLKAYRTPQPGTSTQDAATGKRKTFAPPDQY